MKITEIKERLTKTIMSLPGGESLVKNGVFESVKLLNNGLGSVIEKQIGIEEFREKMIEINYLNDKFIEERNCIVMEKQGLLKMFLSNIKGSEVKDKEDMLQDLNISAISALNNYDEDKGPVDNYLLVWLKGCKLKSSKRLKTICFSRDEDIENICSLNLYDEVEKHIENEKLRNVVDTLPENERDIIDSRYFKDMSRVDVAKKMSKRPYEIKRLEKDILKKLREKIVHNNCLAENMIF